MSDAEDDYFGTIDEAHMFETEQELDDLAAAAEAIRQGREARYAKEWDGVERRTLVRRRADDRPGPLRDAALRGEIPLWMGEVVDATCIEVTGREVHSNNFCPLCAASRYDECPEARKVMGIAQRAEMKADRRSSDFSAGSDRREPRT